MSEAIDVCECYQCIIDNDIREPISQFPLYLTRVIVCTECGNKRCPKATNHRNKCTNSNESGQPGSRYF
jgi:ribosomal protein L40E